MHGAPMMLYDFISKRRYHILKQTYFFCGGGGATQKLLDLCWQFCKCRQKLIRPGGGVLDFGLDGGVPPGPRDPNPCLE